MKKVTFIKSIGVKIKMGLIGRLCLALSAVFAVVAIPLLPLHQPRAQAASLWMDGVTIADETIASDRVNRGNLECEYFSPTSKYVSGYTRAGDRFSGQVVFGDETTEATGRMYPDVCMAQNDHGLMSSSVWVPEGNDIDNAYPVDAAQYSMLPAPGGSAVLFVTPAPISGLQYSINHNLLHIGKLDVRTFGSGSNLSHEKIWKIDLSKLDEFLTYSDRQVVRITQVGFSSNGKYMAAQIAGRGTVLIDLHTKQMTPFLVDSVVNNSGIGIFMTVSNDGRYVGTYASGMLQVHDVSGCETKFDYGQWPSTSVLPTAGCHSSPNFFFNEIRSAYPSATDIARLRFSPNAASLYVDVNVSVAAGGWRRARLDAIGYVSQAKGYLALGDSFSSGEGDTEGGQWYEPGTDEQGDIDTFAGRNLCHLSRRSYPYLLAVEAGYLSNNATTPDANGLFHSVACSGAKMHNITGLLGEKQDDGDASEFGVADNQYRYSESFLLSHWQPGATSQKSLIVGTTTLESSENRSVFTPEALTLGIGGNDIGFGDIIQDCIRPGTCEFAQTGSKKNFDAVRRVAENKSRLVNAYKQLKTDAPETRIYVHGYPQIVERTGGHCSVNVLLDTQERIFAAEITTYLNQMIKAAAEEAGVFYVDVESILEGRQLCSNVEQNQILVNGATAGNDVRVGNNTEGKITYAISRTICLRACAGMESYHPRPEAHVEYSRAVEVQTQNLTAQMPASTARAIPLPSAYFGAEAIQFVSDLNAQGGFALKPLALQENLITGYGFGTKTMSLHLSALAPNSSVEIIVESTPVSLGTFTSNAQGEVIADVSLPASIETGYHEIHAIGRSQIGKPVEYYQPFTLGAEESDFDGDTIPNDIDSCISVQNSGVDVDEDGVDDACDERPVAPVIVPPVAPGAPDLRAESDSGSNSEDNYTNDTTPEFTVNCVADNVVTLYEAEQELGGTSCLDGTASITSVLADGEHLVYAKQKDTKSSSISSESLIITVDSTAPSTLSVPDLSTSSDTGSSDTDNITSSSTLVFNGACTSEEIVAVYIDQVLNATVPCADDMYEASVSAPILGVRYITVAATDKAGNESAQSQSLAVTMSSGEPVDENDEDDENETDDKKCKKHPVRDRLKCKIKKLKRRHMWVFETPHKNGKKVHVIARSGHVSISIAAEHLRQSVRVR